MNNDNCIISVGETLPREFWIDAVRSFACLCVITDHAPIPNCGSGLWAIPVFNYFAMSGGSPLFFMISGALVLFREREFSSFMKKRMSRIVLPVFLWTIVSLLVALAENKITYGDFWTKFVHIPFKAQVGTYWFIYVIMGLYLLTPLLSKWLSVSSKKDVQIYLLIWFATLCIPYLKGFVDVDALVRFDAGYLHSFYGFMGFAIMGYYLRKYEKITKRKIIVVALCGVIFPFSFYLFPNVDHGFIQNRLALHSVIICSFYFLLVKSLRIPPFMQKIVYNFAQHSFGIYLVHIIVMRSFLWPLLRPLEIHYVLQIPLIVVLTAVISYSVVHVISKLPGSKYIVGL